jgi:hypothetical protein
VAQEADEEAQPEHTNGGVQAGHQERQLDDVLVVLGLCSATAAAAAAVAGGVEYLVVKQNTSWMTFLLYSACSWVCKVAAAAAASWVMRSSSGTAHQQLHSPDEVECACVHYTASGLQLLIVSVNQNSTE